MPIDGTMNGAPLRAIILRDENETLVVQASPEEVQRFDPRVGQEIVLQHIARAFAIPGQGLQYGDYTYTTSSPATPQVRSARGVIEPRADPPQVLYDARHRPVCFIHSVDVDIERFNITVFGDPQPTYISGRPHLRISVEVLDGVTIG